MTCVSLRYMFDFKLDTYAQNLRICMHISNQIHVYDKRIYTYFRDICICMLYIRYLYAIYFS